MLWTGGYSATGSAEYRFSRFTQGDHPLRVLLAFLLSRNGDGANGTHDILPPGWGIGLDMSRVDVAGIEALALEWLPGQRHLWLYAEPITSLKEAMASLLKAHLCWPIVTLGDKLSVRRLQPSIPGVTVRAIAAANIVEIPTWDANVVDVVGRTIYLCDFDPLTDKHRQKFTGEMQGPGTEAQELYAGQFQELTINARGAFTGNDPGSVGFFGSNLNTGATDSALRFFETVRDLYGRPPPLIGVECSYDCLDIESGDSVDLTAEHLPDTTTGGEGLTAARCLVISRGRIDDATGRVPFALMPLPLQWSGTRRIAPAEAVVSTAAGVIKIADADGALFARGLFAVGDVIEVWTSNLYLSLGTATLTGVTDGGTTLDLTMATVPPGAGAGDVVTIASYDSAAAAQRARYAFLADATETLGSGAAAAHQYAI